MSRSGGDVACIPLANATSRPKKRAGGDAATAGERDEPAWRLGTVDRVPGSVVACPVCAGADLTELFHLASIPTNNAILCDDVTAARSWPVGSLRLVVCHGCGFIFNADFDAHQVEYSGRIEETQSFSAHFVRYAQWLAGEWIDRYDLHDKTILEVGCGKAEFLAMMCGLGDNRGIGYDPGVHLDRVDDQAGARLTLVPELFGDDDLGVEADALVCRHTLEHLPDVHAFLSMLYRWAAQRDQAPVVLVEVPDVERVLDEVAFWDVYYEHCSYFTADTLRFAFERAGFEVIDIRRAYDDQYLVLEARPRPIGAGGAVSDRRRADAADETVARARRFAEQYRSITSVCRANLQRLVDAGDRVVLWGGGAKAVSFLTSLDVGDLVDFAVDVNPNKQGKFLVGAGHPVFAPERLRGRAGLQVVVMNPVYVAEIAQTVESLGVAATIASVNDLLEAAPTHR